MRRAGALRGQRGTHEHRDDRKNYLGRVERYEPPFGATMQITLGLAEHAPPAAQSGTIGDLRAKARQELTMRMAERQPNVAQELALARRVESGDDVEMEEFYDISGSNHVAIKTGETGTAQVLGAGPKGHAAGVSIQDQRPVR